MLRAGRLNKPKRRLSNEEFCRDCVFDCAPRVGVLCSMAVGVFRDLVGVLVGNCGRSAFVVPCNILPVGSGAPAWGAWGVVASETILASPLG